MKGDFSSAWDKENRDRDRQRPCGVEAEALPDARVKPPAGARLEFVFVNTSFGVIPVPIRDEQA